MAPTGDDRHGGRRLSVREMRLDEVRMRIDYFHGASDDHLRLMGVDRGLLPSPEDWAAAHAEDHARPLAERQAWSLVWELDGEPVGFSSADRIELGVQAYMHLHILRADRRHAGLGARFVRLSAQEYARALGVRRLYSQPNAFNRAPNRTLQRAGFRYVETREAEPGPINPRQAVTLWVLELDPPG